MAEAAIATMTTGAAMRAAVARLRDSGIADPAHDAALLLGHCLGLDRLGLLRRNDNALAAASAAQFDRLVARRLAGEPVSRICGMREFWSLDFALSPAVLDPRPDSETLIAAVLRHVGDRDAPLRILDLGTGSGCLLLALLTELPRASGLGVDRSPAAAEQARANAHRLGLDDRARFCVGDWGDTLAGGFDVVVSNPPYIPSAEIAGLAPEVRLFDPTAALDGGADGLDAYRRIASDLPRLLTMPGMVAFECGHDQADAVGEILSHTGLSPVETACDLAGIPRCVVATIVAE